MGGAVLDHMADIWIWFVRGRRAGEGSITFFVCFDYFYFHRPHNRAPNPKAGRSGIDQSGTLWQMSGVGGRGGWWAGSSM